MSELDNVKSMVLLAQRVIREQNEKIRNLRMKSGVMEHRISQLETMIQANTISQEGVLVSYSNDDMKDEVLNSIENYDNNEPCSLDGGIMFENLSYSNFNLDCNHIPLTNENEIQILQSESSTSREPIMCKKNDNILNLFNVEGRENDLLNELAEKGPQHVREQETNEVEKANDSIVYQYMKIYNDYLDQQLDQNMEICSLNLDCSQLDVGGLDAVCLSDIPNKTDNCNIQIDANKSKQSVKKPRTAKTKSGRKKKTPSINSKPTAMRLKPKEDEEVYDILNIKSIYTKEMEESSVEIVRNKTRLLETTNHADQLIKIVQQNQLQLFTTDDKDTFIISVNGDMDPNHIRKLLSDGILTIHVDEEEKGIPDNKIEIINNSSNVTNTYNTTNVVNQTPLLQMPDVNNIVPVKNFTNNDVIMVLNSKTDSNHSNALNNMSISLSDIDIDNLLKLNNGNAGAANVNWDQNKLIFIADGVEGEVVKQKIVKEFVCKQCGVKFHRKQNYLAHKSSHNEKLKAHCCEHCKEKFSWRSSLVRHMESNHSTIMEKCSQCTKSFHSKRYLQTHVRRVHMNERKLQCTHSGCNKTFYNNYSLTLHVRTHTGERVYACGICGMKFNHASHRLRHEKSHTNIV